MYMLVREHTLSSRRWDAYCSRSFFSCARACLTASLSRALRASFSSTCTALCCSHSAAREAETRTTSDVMQSVVMQRKQLSRSELCQDLRMHFRHVQTVVDYCGYMYMQSSIHAGCIQEAPPGHMYSAGTPQLVLPIAPQHRLLLTVLLP